MTCVASSSPTRAAARWPAATAAHTAATSPTTLTTTKPPVLSSLPTGLTRAAFTMTSAASMAQVPAFQSDLRVVRTCESPAPAAVNYSLTSTFGHLGRIISTSACGRGMTCTEASSPTFSAAAAPASTAAFTAPTSPHLLPANELHLCRLDHRVCRLDGTHQALGLDQSQGVERHTLLPLLSSRVL